MAKFKFDVFLSHNRRDQDSARQLKRLLEEQGQKVWLDVDELPPGFSWQPGLDKGIKDSKSIVVLVGSDGIGDWQNEEVQHALTLAAKDRRPVIGVLLPGAPNLQETSLPWTVQNRTIVDLRDGLDGPGLRNLLWGNYAAEAGTASRRNGPEQAGRSGGCCGRFLAG